MKQELQAYMRSKAMTPPVIEMAFKINWLKITEHQCQEILDKLKILEAIPEEEVEQEYKRQCKKHNVPYVSFKS